MTLSKKTKDQLIAEVKKLQRKVELLQKKQSDTSNFFGSPNLKSAEWDSFFKSSLNTIVIIDKKGIILDINKVAPGTKKENVIGKSAFGFIVKEAVKTMKVAIEKVFTTKKPQEYNSWRIDANGDSHYYRTKATALIENKKVVAVILDATEITSEIQIHLQLKESEHKFRMLAENATDLVYRYSLYPEPKYEYVSPSVKAFTGYSPRDFYSNPLLVFKIVHPEDVHLLGDSEKLIKEKARLSNVKQSEITVRWIKKDGSIIWTETRTRPIFDKEKRLIAIEGISRDVTAQKHSEEKSKDSEERFKILSNATFEGIVFSENGKIIDANDQFVNMYGYNSSKEIIGKNLINDFVVEEQKQLAKKFVRLSVAKPFEVDTHKKDGSIITVETKGQNIPYFGKTIRATVIYNITERKQYEFNLRESERTLSTLMNNLPGMAYRCENDDKWTMKFVSKGFQELTGYNPKEIINNKKRAFSDIIHPNDRNVGKKEIKKALETHSPFEIEYRLITAAGKAKWVWEKGEGVFSEDGKLLFIEGFITDIDYKKGFELELKRSRENYKSLVDFSPDGVIIHIDGIVKFANPSALKIIGVDGFEELENTSVLDFILPEYHTLVLQRINQAKAGEKLDFIEIKIKNKKGQTIVLDTKPAQIKFNGIEATQVVFHDVSEKKLLLKEQARAQIAEQTNELLEQEITKRKVIQLQLQESQKYTRLIINGSIDMICASDRKGYITEFNEAAQKTFGYTSKEVIGKHVSILYDDPNERIKITDEQLYKKGVYAGEVTNKRKNGEKFVAYLSASILKNEDGEVIGAMGVSRDISELKKAELALKESEEKYRDLLENATDLIQSVGMKGEVNYVNSEWKRVLGYSNSEIENGNIFNFIHPDSIEHCKSVFTKIAQGEIPGNIEIAFITKEGEQVICEGNVSCKFEKGQVVSTRGIFRNITTSKKIAKEIKESQDRLTEQSAKFNAIIESSTHVIWTVDKNICLTTFNQNYAKQQMARYGLEATVGLSMIKGKAISTEEYNNFWIKKYENAFAGEPQYFETQFFDKDGTETWREIYLNPITNEEGIVHEVSGIGHDITEKKMSEERIRQSLQEKEVLLKEVHHRVKNNLQVISSILNLQSSYVKDEGTLQILKESQNRIKSMAFIHESLYQTKDFSSINFTEYVINLSQNLIHSYSNFDNEVKLNLDIQNVFLNLDLAIPCGLIINEIVSNALKYAFVDNSEGGEISISMKTEGDYLELRIGDNGKGLPQNIDYRNTESLGLQLVVTLTDQLSGTIELDTEQGTNYTIIFKHNQVKNRI